MAEVKTLFVKTRKAAKDYPAFGVSKGMTIYKWRAQGKKFISLTDPRASAAPAVAEAVTVEPVTVEPEPVKPVTKKAAPKVGLRKAAKAQAPVAEDLPPE